MIKIANLVRSAGLLAVSLTFVRVCLSDYALNYTCSPPTTLGGTGYCGPAFCANAVSTLSSCIFTSKTYDYPLIISGLQKKTCTQSTDPRCTSAALAALFKGQGVKAAYCNNEFLVIHSDGTPGFSTYLDSIPNPPGSVSSSGTNCVTRLTNPDFKTMKIPLYPTLLTTSDPAINNVNTKSYPNGGGDFAGGYLSAAVANSGATYGLPTRGSIGITIGGQEIFPVFNNLAYLAPQKCEVDTCNQHVGGGGGQPHLHGDPFGTWCLYSKNNYTSPTVHPPQIGWALDGLNIYGRHLSTSNTGYSTALDSCGGHVHGDYTYHYHAQVLNATTDSGVYFGQKKGASYYASTTGPYKCLKGDISLVKNYWGNFATSYTSESPDTTTHMCSGSTNYYVASGITLPNTDTTYLRQPSGPPTRLPSVAPSISPSRSPTRSPTVATTVSPTGVPLISPTLLPSRSPTRLPTKQPHR